MFSKMRPPHTKIHAYISPLNHTKLLRELTFEDYEQQENTCKLASCHTICSSNLQGTQVKETGRQIARASDPS